MDQILISAGSMITDFNQDVKFNQAVLIENRKIAEIGDPEALSDKFPKAFKAGGKQYLLMPAMVDAHDHGRALGTAPLGVSDDFLEAWIPGLWAQPSIDPYLAALYDGLRLIRSGVGSVVHYHNARDWNNIHEEANATLRGYRDAGIRAIFCPPFLDQNQLVYLDAEGFLESLPDNIRDSARPFAESHPYSLEAYFEICKALTSEWCNPQDQMSDIQINPVGGQWVSDESIVTLTDFALQNNQRVQMHLLETMYQREYAYMKWKKSFVSHLDDLGVLGSWLTCAHMVWIEDQDIGLLASRGVSIVSNPSSNLRLRSGTAQLAKLNAAGLDIGIGLDGHGLDDDQDYLREMRMAWFLSNRPGVQSETLSARDVGRMATSGGAKVTWGSDMISGKIIPGAKADLVLMDQNALQGVWYSPKTDLVDVLLQHGTCQFVDSVMIDGHWVFEHGKSCTVPVDEVASQIRESIQKQPENGMDETAARLTPHIRQYYSSWKKD